MPTPKKRDHGVCEWPGCRRRATIYCDKHWQELPGTVRFKLNQVLTEARSYAKWAREIGVPVYKDGKVTRRKVK